MPLRVIPVRMTAQQIEELETLQGMGFASRSDAMRCAISAMLKKLQKQNKTPAA